MPMRTTLLLVFIILIASVKPVFTQEIWSLQDCIEYAMDHNLQIQKAGLNNERNEESYRQSIRNLLPSLNASSRFRPNFGKSIDPNTNDIVYQSFFSSSYSAGTSVSIFQGFSRVNRIAFSKILWSTGQFDEQALKAALSFQIMDAYYNVIFIKGLITISDSLLAQSQWNHNFVAGMISNGLKAESDILEVEAELASEQLRKLRALNDYDQAVLKLKQLINLDMGVAFEIRQVVPDLPENINWDHSIDSLYITALNTLPEIKSFGERVQASIISLAMTKANYYPSLGLYAGIGTGYYQTFLDPTGNVIPFVDQLSNNASQYLSFSMSIPLFNKGSYRSQTKLARIQLKETKLSLVQEQERVYQDIQQDWQKLLAVKMEIDQAKIQVEAREAAEAISRRKFEKGLVNQFEYSQAKSKLAQAKSDLLNTSIQYIITRRTIDYYQGLPISGM
jgi:outer membrane protein